MISQIIRRIQGYIVNMRVEEIWAFKLYKQWFFNSLGVRREKGYSYIHWCLQFSKALLPAWSGCKEITHLSQTVFVHSFLPSLPPSSFSKSVGLSITSIYSSRFSILDMLSYECDPVVGEKWHGMFSKPQTPIQFLLCLIQCRHYFYSYLKRWKALIHKHKFVHLFLIEI